MIWTLTAMQLGKYYPCSTTEETTEVQRSDLLKNTERASARNSTSAVFKQVSISLKSG